MYISKKCDNPASLEASYLTSLDEGKGEQHYQQFLEENTYLIPREFLQNHGVHFDLVLRKLPLGSDYCCDFLYLSKSSIQWNCVLIEIEKPQSKYFKSESLEFHSDFESALEQVSNWRAWMDVPANKESFLSNSLGFLRTPLGDNPTDMKYVLIHGRRSESERNSQRRAKIRSQERPDFRIMSFDSLKEDVASKNALYVGIKKNDHIEICSNEFVSENVFVWLEPEMIKVSSRLLAEMEQYRGKINALRSLNNGFTRAVDHYLDKNKA